MPDQWKKLTKTCDGEGKLKVELGLVKVHFPLVFYITVLLTVNKLNSLTKASFLLT